MNPENIKSNSISLVGFVIGSALWIHFFSKLGIGLGSSTDFNLIFSLIKIEPLTNLGLMAVCFGIAAVFLIFDAYKRPLMEKIGVAFIGTGVTYLMAMGMFANKFQYNMIMLFYLLAAIVAVFFIKQNEPGMGKKFRTGAASAKKLVLILALGAALTTYMVVSTNLPEYQLKMKSDIISMAGNIDIASMTQGAGEGFLRQEIEKQLDQMTDYDFVASQYPKPTEADVRTQVKDFYANDSNFKLLPEDQQQKIIDNVTTASYKKAIEDRETAIQKVIQDAQVTGPEREAKIDALLAEAQNKIGETNFSSEELQAQLEKKFDEVIDSMPIIQTIFDILPIANAFANFTAIMFIGNILLVPISGLVALVFLREPKKAAQYENEQQKQQREMQSIEEHASKMKQLKGN